MDTSTLNLSGVSIGAMMDAAGIPKDTSITSAGLSTPPAPRSSDTGGKKGGDKGDDKDKDKDNNTNIASFWDNSNKP